MKNLPRLTLLCLLLLPLPAMAQEQGTADERQACEPDVNRLCSQFIPDRDKIILCLNQKVRELNPSCRSVMLFYAQQQICAGDSSRLCGEFAQDREKTLACLADRGEHARDLREAATSDPATPDLTSQRGSLVQRRAAGVSRSNPGPLRRFAS